MSGLKRVNRRPVASAYTPSPSTTPAPVLYPPSGGGSGVGSGRVTPSWGAGGVGMPGGVGPGARLSPPIRPGSSASGASQYSESPFGGGMSSGPGTRTAHELEGHNDDLLKGLLGKVDVLKNVGSNVQVEELDMGGYLTIGIGDEVRAGNLELAGMTDDFGSTSNVLSGTWKRMTRMANRQGSHWCWFMMFLIFVLWIFMLLWWSRR